MRSCRQAYIIRSESSPGDITVALCTALEDDSRLVPTAEDLSQPDQHDSIPQRGLDAYDIIPKALELFSASHLQLG
jgi:hypothetical protein